MSVITISLALIACCVRSSIALTPYGRDFRFECPVGQHISSLRSTYSTTPGDITTIRSDRRWEYGCAGGFATDDCTWGHDDVAVNELGRDVNDIDSHFRCKDESGNSDRLVITGVLSQFKGGNIRVWNYKCCKIRHTPGTDCRLERDINRRGEAMDVDLPLERAMTGISYHRPNDSPNLDYAWNTYTCRFARCPATKLNILDRVNSMNDGQKIIGVVAGQQCRPGVSATLQLSRTDSVEETMGLSLAAGSEINWGTSISVGAEVSAGFLGNGATATFGVEQSVGGAVTAERSENTDTTIGGSDSASNSLTYTGPGAGIIIGTVTKYRLDADNVNVEITSTCNNGSQERTTKRMKIFGKTYGYAFFDSRTASYSPNKCGRATAACLRQVRGQYALDSSVVFGDFENCIRGRGHVMRIG